MIAQTSSDKTAQIASLQLLSDEQEQWRRRGIQKTYSQAELGRRLGLTRARVEQIEIVAKLRLLRRLAAGSGQVFLDLGGTYDQLAFLKAMTVSSADARRLWQQWCRLGQ